MKKYGEVSFEFLIPHSRKAILHQTLGRGTLSEKCLITDQLEEKTFKGKRYVVNLLLKITLLLLVI